MCKIDSFCAKLSAHQRKFLQIRQSIASYRRLYDKGNSTKIASCNCTHNTNERAFTPPFVMRFLGGTVKAEADGTNRRQILHQKWVDPIKMPSVSYKSKPDPGIDYRFYDLVEPGMDCNFTPGKRNIRNAHDFFGFTNNLLQEFR